MWLARRRMPRKTKRRGHQRFTNSIKLIWAKPKLKGRNIPARKIKVKPGIIKMTRLFRRFRNPWGRRVNPAMKRKIGHMRYMSMKENQLSKSPKNPAWAQIIPKKRRISFSPRKKTRQIKNPPTKMSTGGHTEWIKGRSKAVYDNKAIPMATKTIPSRIFLFR